MSLGDRRRNSLFEEEPSEQEEETTMPLDSRFVIEPREPVANQGKTLFEEDEPRKREKKRRPPPKRKPRPEPEPEEDEDWEEEDWEEEPPQKTKAKPEKQKPEKSKPEKQIPEEDLETGWQPQRNRKPPTATEEEPITVVPHLDPRFAEELAPNKEWRKGMDKRLKEEKPRKKQAKTKADWGSPPVYGDQEALVKEKTKIPPPEEPEEVEDNWDEDYEEDYEEEYQEEELPPKPSWSPEQLPKPPARPSKPRPDVGRVDRKHDIFFQGKEPQEFRTVLTQVQEFISTNYSQLITENPDDSKEQMKRYISKYILDKKVVVEGRTTEELLEELYVEMAEYGFLTKYVFGTGIEEIDINAWNDIEVQYSGGKTAKLKEHFDSPDHAINVIRRMLQSAGIVLDNSQPVVLGHLSKNIRIAVMKTPIVDEDVGISASIRIVNPQSMEKKDFVNGGTATEKMLDFLTTCVRYGVSICVAGATSSGKTTVLGWLLTTIPSFKRVYTIESGSRELDLVKYDEDGYVCNSVIHTLTRDSDNDKQKVDQIALLDVALRFNPDVVVVGEMRGPEANAAQEAARTGVAVLTTIHANSARATYARMISLCKRAVDMGDETLYQYVTEAYSIIVFCKQLENGSRRMMEIMECVIEKDGTRVYRTLFQYIITENKFEEGKFIIEGEHKQVNPISQQLAKRFLENGMPVSEIKQWTEVSQ